VTILPLIRTFSKKYAPGLVKALGGMYKRAKITNKET
jgi:hypothetical protein